MTVKLWVNWRGNEILTTRQLDDKIDEAVKDRLEDEDCYAEELEEYLDSNYTKMELFEALTDDRINKEKFIKEIREGVEEQVRDWCDRDIRGDYDEYSIED